jgi:hypothetical protein
MRNERPHPGIGAVVGGVDRRAPAGDDFPWRATIMQDGIPQRLAS